MRILKLSLFNVSVIVIAVTMNNNDDIDDDVVYIEECNESNSRGESYSLGFMNDDGSSNDGNAEERFEIIPDALMPIVEGSIELDTPDDFSTLNSDMVSTLGQFSPNPVTDGHSLDNLFSDSENDYELDNIATAIEKQYSNESGKQPHSDHNFCQASPNVQILNKQSEHQSSDSSNKENNASVEIVVPKPIVDNSSSNKAPGLDIPSIHGDARDISSVSIVSQDHDYLLRKITSLNSNTLSKETINEGFERIQKLSQRFLNGEQDLHTSMDLIADEMQKLIPPTDHEIEAIKLAIKDIEQQATSSLKKNDAVIEEKPNEHKENNRSDIVEPITSIIVKEEYQMESEIINLPINEPLVVEEVQTSVEIAINDGNIQMDIDPNNADQINSQNLLQDPRINHLSDLQELGSSLSKEAAKLITEAESQNPITEILEQIFSKLCTNIKELAIKLDIQTGFKLEPKADMKEASCQVRYRVFFTFCYFLFMLLF